MKISLFNDCYSGADFENRMAQILRKLFFTTKITGKADKGIDIIATDTIQV